MGTDPSAPSASTYPWSTLGLAPTADKAAIHAAHDARRAELDAATARISDFADLTAAREKALFLAADIERRSTRQATALPANGEGREPPAPPEPAQPERPEPEPERVPEAGPEREPEPEPESDREPAPEWEHAGSYKPDVSHAEDTLAGDLAQLMGLDDSYRNGADGAWSGAGPTPFIERYRLDRYGFFWLFGILLLLSVCSGR